MKYKGIIILLLVTGILFITIETIKSSHKCQPQKVVYRYIPRTFEEEQEDPNYVSEIFKTMFTKPSPWVDSIGTYDRRAQEKVNNYFISQS